MSDLKMLADGTHEHEGDLAHVFAVPVCAATCSNGLHWPDYGFESTSVRQSHGQQANKVRAQFTSSFLQLGVVSRW